MGGSLSEQQKSIVVHLTNILKPRPKLSGSEWVNKYFYLSPESSAAPGKVTLYPYQEELMDVMCDYETQFVIFKKPTRVGFTKLLNMTQAYFIHQRPSSILHAQPNNEEMRGYATDEFEPMVRDNKIISDLIDAKVVRGKNKTDRTLKKSYPGGIWEGVGAESSRNFNRRTVRVFMADEIDTWVLEADKAGDTLTTGMRRTSDFWDRKNIMGGKPIIKETSKVLEWFDKGDQRHRYLPCPHCGHKQIWGFDDFIWDKELAEDGSVIRHLPDTVYLKCAECKEKIYDHHKREMDKGGEWVAHEEFTGIASFYIWAMFSYSPNVTWPDIVREFLSAIGNPLKLKAFHNEVLAQGWEDEFDSLEITDYKDRLEEYEAEVPEEVLILTAGVDTQDNRLEVEVVGWGRYEESWSITYRTFYGDTAKPFVWQELDLFLASKFIHASGGSMTISATGVDTQGHSTKMAYEYCKANKFKSVFALKGANQINAPIVPLAATFTNKGNVPLYLIGVNAAKDVIFSYLATTERGAGYCHWPSNTPYYNAEYFKQLTAEKRAEDGRWVKFRARNEALDVRVYSLAALLLAKVDLELLFFRGPAFWVPPVPKEVVAPSSYLDEY